MSYQSTIAYKDALKDKATAVPKPMGSSSQSLKELTYSAASSFKINSATDSKLPLKSKLGHHQRLASVDTFFNKQP